MLQINHTIHYIKQSIERPVSSVRDHITKMTFILECAGYCFLFLCSLFYCNTTSSILLSYFHLGFMVPSLICQMREQTCSLEELDPCHHMRKGHLCASSYITFAQWEPELGGFSQCSILLSLFLVF